jgi:hypothetical protein
VPVWQNLQVRVQPVIDPVPELARAEGGFADLLHEIGQLLAREADQRALGVGRLRRRLEQSGVERGAHLQAFTAAS